MKTEYEKCMSGEYFEGSDPELVKLTTDTKRLLMKFNSCDYADTKGKTAILRKMFGSMGKNVHIDIDFHCEYGKNIHLGDNVIINMNCTFVDNNSITIGNNVLIASNVQFYTATHPVNYWERNRHNNDGKFFNTYAKPIVIEDGVWIGGGAIVLPGVTIGRNSVIGAGSVVTRDIPENSVAVGNPCRVMRKQEQ